MFSGERAVRFPGKRDDVTLTHPMKYKPQIFKSVVLQCSVDKYAITYQNIRSECMVRPHGAIVTLGNY